ncbi:hypothetical protein [Micromonospora sp. WMMD736]|uniref:hypothetical protein n=1 Tax=Micromonospora sp. WMMD736 TaxID=3404112 RepID=UPI003B942B4E
MLWDDEVDVICTGFGVGALASAVIAVDAGLDVFMARPQIEVLASGSAQPGPGMQWLGPALIDAATSDYFAALTGDLGPLNTAPHDVKVPMRVVVAQSSSGDDRGVEPFFGARLRDWALRCLASPYGFMYTRLGGNQVTTMRSGDGETVEVALVGTLDTSAEVVRLDAGSLTEWLTGQVRDRSIEVSNSSLQRIVFDDGEVAGAVFTTPDGPFAVRARHGVAVSGGDWQHRLEAPGLPAPGGPLQVGLVRQPASRFGRLELLSGDDGPLPLRSRCQAGNRQLPHALRETREPHSPARTCRNVHRYRPAGQ